MYTSAMKGNVVRVRDRVAGVSDKQWLAGAVGVLVAGGISYAGWEGFSRIKITCILLLLF